MIYEHPQSRTFTLAVELRPLHIVAGLYEAKATLTARGGGTRYWLRGIVGPDGFVRLDAYLTPRHEGPPVYGRQDYTPRHDYTDDEIVAAIRARYAAEVSS